MPLKYIVRVDLNVKASQNLGSQLKKKNILPPGRSYETTI